MEQKKLYDLFKKSVMYHYDEFSLDKDYSLDELLTDEEYDKFVKDLTTPDEGIGLAYTTLDLYNNNYDEVIECEAAEMQVSFFMVNDDCFKLSYTISFSDREYIKNEFYTLAEMEDIIENNNFDDYYSNAVHFCPENLS